MKTYPWLAVVALCCLATFSLAACGGQEPVQDIVVDNEPQPAPAEPAPAPFETAPAFEQSAIGEVMDVDLSAMTFVIKDDDDVEHTFHFSDFTDVTGAAGTQGLLGQEGSPALVRYIEEDGIRRAIHIEIQSR